MKKGISVVVLSIVLCFLWACGGNQNTTTKNEASATISSAEAIFQSKCSICHDFNSDKIGPSLAGVLGRWGGDKIRLKSFIKNSQELIKSGDPYSVALYEKWQHSAMPSFNELTEEELNALVDYFK